MTAEATPSAKRRRRQPAKATHAPRIFAGVAPPEARDKLSAARGLVLGLAICAVFWIAVWAVVMLLRP